MDQFFQQAPNFSHPFESDTCLKALLKYFVQDSEKRREIESDLLRFSNRIVDEIEPLSLMAESVEPEHIPYDAWGKRVDYIKVSKEWDKLDEISAEEGLIALGYNRDDRGGHRIHQFAKLYLFHPSSAYYSCPLAMTDGATKLIEVIGDESLKQGAFKHLTSRDPKKFWTSGQWMTERAGGSDVGKSETHAKFEDGQWKLYGVKWFTSATTSQMAMTLARVIDENGDYEKGSRGLSLFYLELRNEKGELQNIQVNRLKDKLGTKALPTAELTLEGTPAKLIGEKGRGVAQIATLFNVTRIYNTSCTLGAFRRVLSLAEDYAHKREAFGKKLINHPLHQRMLNEIKSELIALSALSFFVIDLLDKNETLKLGEDKKINTKLLRLFTPIAKLYSAKINMNATSELIESFGGAGYVEDTGLPRWLRDAQVLTIWEGTTNVLSLDTLRAMVKDQPLPSLLEILNKKLLKAKENGLDKPYLEKCDKELNFFTSVLKELEDKAAPSDWEYVARELSFSIARLMQGFLLADLCSSEKLSDIEKEEFQQAMKVFYRKKWIEIQLPF